MRLGTERMAYKKEDYHRQEKKLVETKKRDWLIISGQM